MAVVRSVDVSVGDTVEVSARRVGDPGRRGEILSVLGDDERAHYRVRWEDGHETILYPGDATIVREFARPVGELLELLQEAGVEVEVLPHPRTVTAGDEARALGVLPQTVAKTLVVHDEGGERIRAVVPASCRLDLGRLARTIGADAVVFVREVDLAYAYPQFELGAVPPFGGPGGERVVVDRHLAECEYVVFEAGIHEAALRIRCEDLLVVADAQLADIVED